MAGVGLEGHEDTIGTPYGVLHAWGEPGGRETVVRALGEDFRIMGANFKFINAGYPIHAPVEAALKLVQANGLRCEDIDQVDVGMPTNTMRVVDSRDMHNICLQDMLSAALVRNGLKLRESPFPSVLGEPEFARLRPRVSLRGHPDLDRDQPDGRGCIVTFTTRSGAVLTERVDHPRGHSKRGGVTWEELAAKWREGLPECDVDRIVELATRLEDVEDARELLDAFTG